jgi:hypothetical protein
MKNSSAIVALRCLSIACALFASALPPAAAAAEPAGTALVIAGESYAGQPRGTGCGPLARAVADRLRGQGFAVDLRIDAPTIMLRSTIDDFAASLESGPAGHTLVYVCAASVGEGARLFVLPADADAGTALQPETQGVAMQALLNALAGTGGALYADLSLPSGNTAKGFQLRLPEGLHAALALYSQGDQGTLGKFIADAGSPDGQDWPQIVGKLKTSLGAGAKGAMMFLPDAAVPAVPLVTHTAPAPAAPPIPPPATPVPPAPVPAAPAPARPAAAPASVPAKQAPPPSGAEAVGGAITSAPPASSPTPPGALPPPAPPGTPGPDTKRRWEGAAPPIVLAPGGNPRTARIQAALARHHAYAGPINGLSDARTQAAIRAYQVSLGDPPSGALTRPEIVRLLNF